MENQSIQNYPFPDFGALLESVKENGRRMDENYNRYLKEKAEREAQWEAERKTKEEHWEKERQAHKDFCEMMMAKWDRMLEEDQRKHAEFKEWMKKSEEETKRLRDENATKWGRLVEALCAPAALKLFKDLGIGIQNIYREGESIKATVNGVDKMEVDVLLENCSVLVAVEVKTTCSVEDVKYFIQQMQKFRYYFPRFGERTVYGAMAAISYKGKAVGYAQKQGLFTLKLSGEDTFTMINPETPKTF